MDKKKSKRKEASKYVSQEARRRMENPPTPTIPGLEDFVSSAQIVIRSNGHWRNAEEMVKHALLLGHYCVNGQVKFGRAHECDLLADFICYLPSNPTEKILVSVKWLTTSGSWDRKIPDDVATWDRNLPFDGVRRGYVVLYGPGFSQKQKNLWCDAGTIDTGVVTVLDMDTFSARAWSREL